MKATIKTIFLTVLVCCLSCTDMLEQVDPTGPTGNDFFSNEQELIFAVNSVYAGLSPGTGLYGGHIVGLEQLSDNICTGSSIVDGSTARWSSFSFDPTDGGIQRSYETLYVIIARANQVIKNAPDVPGLSQEKLNNYLGQARFIRGFAYFMLTLSFGEVPLITEPASDPTGVAIAKSAAADIYTQVLDDITFAESALPAVQADKGRVTSMAAKAMLARVYLFGADELGNSSWYGMAEQKAAEVIQSGNYSLFNDPEKTPAENLLDIYRLENQLTTGKEEIFYVQHFNNGGAWNDGDVGTEVPMQLNARLNRNFNLFGYGWGMVYEATINMWEDGDARKDFNLWLTGEPIIVNGVQRGLYTQLGHARSNVKPEGAALQKYWYAENFKTINGRSNQNIPVIRYADVLLMHAEADLMADGTLSDDGLASFNQVRNRAGLPALTAGDVDRAVILHERRAELFGEFHRWFDLMRTRTAEEAFAALKAGDTNDNDNEKLGFTAARHYKFPLPQAALERNPALEQNPAWSGL